MNSYTVIECQCTYMYRYPFFLFFLHGTQQISIICLFVVSNRTLKEIKLEFHLTVSYLSHFNPLTLFCYFTYIWFVSCFSKVLFKPIIGVKPSDNWLLQKTNQTTNSLMISFHFFVTWIQINNVCDKKDFVVWNEFLSRFVNVDTVYSFYVITHY